MATSHDALARLAPVLRALARRGPSRRPAPAELAVAYSVGLRDFARLVGVSPRTVRAWVEQGLPALRLPGKILVIREEAVRWLERYRTPGRVTSIVDDVLGGLR